MSQFNNTIEVKDNYLVEEHKLCAKIEKHLPTPLVPTI